MRKRLTLTATLRPTAQTGRERSSLLIYDSTLAWAGLLRDGLFGVDCDGRSERAYRLSPVVLPRPACAVRRRRARRGTRRISGTGEGMATDRAMGICARFAAARRRADSRRRQIGQRRTALAATFHRERATVRIREARGRLVCGELRRPQGGVDPCRTTVEANAAARIRAAARRHGDHRLVARARARFRRVRRHRVDRVRHSVSRRTRLALVSRPGDALTRRAHRDHGRRAVSFAAPVGLSRSMGRSAAQGLSTVAFVDRVRPRRMVRRGTRLERRKAPLPSRGAYRFSARCHC